MDKKKLSRLIQLADEALRSSHILSASTNTIDDSFNGQTSGLSVTIAMNGLLPALVIYYQQASESRKIDRRKILEAIGKMIEEEMNKNEFSFEPAINNANTLLRAAIKTQDAIEYKKLKQEVLDCAIALKQVIRTYELV